MDHTPLLDTLRALADGLAQLRPFFDTGNRVGIRWVAQAGRPPEIAITQVIARPNAPFAQRTASHGVAHKALPPPRKSLSAHQQLAARHLVEELTTHMQRLAEMWQAHPRLAHTCLSASVPAHAGIGLIWTHHPQQPQLHLELGDTLWSHHTGRHSVAQTLDAIVQASRTPPPSPTPTTMIMLLASVVGNDPRCHAQVLGDPDSWGHLARAVLGHAPNTTHHLWACAHELDGREPLDQHAGSSSRRGDVQRAWSALGAALARVDHAVWTSRTYAWHPDGTREIPSPSNGADTDAPRRKPWTPDAALSTEEERALQAAATFLDTLIQACPAAQGGHRAPPAHLMLPHRSRGVGYAPPILQVFGSGYTDLDDVLALLDLPRGTGSWLLTRHVSSDPIAFYAAATPQDAARIGDRLRAVGCAFLHRHLASL